MPDPQQLADPDMELVVVLNTNEPVAFSLAKGSLEKPDIPFVAENEITRLVNEVDPQLRKWTRLLVPRDREAEARDLLAPLFAPLQPEPTGENR